MSLDEDLDILGAEGLSGQYIVLRVKSIDKPRLAQGIGGGAAGAALPAALALVDLAPQEALNLLMPMAQKKVLAGYGVDLEYQITDVPPAKGERPKSNSGKMVLLGAGLGAVGLWAASHFGMLAAGRGLVDTGSGLLHKAGGAGRGLLHRVGL